MSGNNPAQDRYNPPSTINDEDFQSEKFVDVSTGEIFWRKPNKNNSNHAYRKLNESEALDTKTQEVVVFNRNNKVFYKL